MANSSIFKYDSITCITSSEFKESSNRKRGALNCGDTDMVDHSNIDSLNDQAVICSALKEIETNMGDQKSCEKKCMCRAEIA